MKSAAIVVPLTREIDEVLNVFGRFVGGELEAKDAEVGSDDRFEIGRRLGERGGGRHEGEEKGTHQIYRNWWDATLWRKGPKRKLKRVNRNDRCSLFFASAYFSTFVSLISATIVAVGLFFPKLGAAKLHLTQM